MPDLSLSPNGGTTNCQHHEATHGVQNHGGGSFFPCPNPLILRCHQHRHQIEVRCGRWRTCPACGAWKRWTLTRRLIAGIEQVPDGKLPMMVTLTFPRDNAPDEDGAHKALRKLVARLRHRELLGAYSWVLERQANGDPDGVTDVERWARCTTTASGTCRSSTASMSGAN